ncbi:hypothetical protein XENOCAPTIV_007376 [Xenoophorus captivus]|uniref:USP domain-containing protein n=1 Tax=Xenoophorus captivus TaxID=1517983 RepID=A0ABV0Q975_9TELE
MQQDAHEFLNYLLNTIADLLQEEKSQERQQNGKLLQNGSGGGSDGGGGGEGEGGKETQQTWVHEIFQGTLTNETRCLNCEAVSGGTLAAYVCGPKESRRVTETVLIFVALGCPDRNVFNAFFIKKILQWMSSPLKLLCLCSTEASATQRHYAASINITVSNVAANRRARKVFVPLEITPETTSEVTRAAWLGLPVTF